MYNDQFLESRLNERKLHNALRTLQLPKGKIDFCSNDYLGIVHNQLLNNNTSFNHGSTGSRLLSGNFELIQQVEQELAQFHACEACLVFNSGYDANVGVLSSIPQKGDTIIYDQLAHASIRDGIRLSSAQSYSFIHNNIEDLEKKIRKASGNVFVVTESIFSMDGDLCKLDEIVLVCKKHAAHLILDEGHALGVVGEHGEGLAQAKHVEAECFARIYTFGKAIGCHGAVVAGTQRLKDYLVNFARSFIFSTALPPSAVNAVRNSYTLFPGMIKQRERLRDLIAVFVKAKLKHQKLLSGTAIQGVIIPGNNAVKEMAFLLQQNQFDVRPILYPSVPAGRERLRIILHAFNTIDEVEKLAALLA